MPLSKRAFSSIQRVVRNRTFTVKLSNIWTEIYNELGVGEVLGKNLNLSKDDHQTLRNWFFKNSGIDPLTDDVPGDRLEVAKVTNNEKFSSIPVFNGFISICSRQKEISLQQGTATTPRGTLLRVKSSDITFAPSDKVVVTENGMAALHWHDFSIPGDVEESIMVYRGHDNEAQHVSRFLKSLPSSVLKIGFFDFDPAGIGMAVDYDCDAILIPDQLTDDLIVGINNKPDTFVDQMRKRPDLESIIPDTLLDLWSWMTSADRKCAITQERLLSNKQQLKLHHIKSNKV